MPRGRDKGSVGLKDRNKEGRWARERGTESKRKRDRYKAYQLNLLLVRQGNTIGTITSNMLQLYLTVGGIYMQGWGRKINLQL